MLNYGARPSSGGSRLGQRLYDTTLGLPQGPGRAVYLEWESVYSHYSLPFAFFPSTLHSRRTGKSAACAILPPANRYPLCPGGYPRFRSALDSLHRVRIHPANVPIYLFHITTQPLAVMEAEELIIAAYEAVRGSTRHKNT